MVCSRPGHRKVGQGRVEHHLVDTWPDLVHLWVHSLAHRFGSSVRCNERAEGVLKHGEVWGGPRGASPAMGFMLTSSKKWRVLIAMLRL